MPKYIIVLLLSALPFFSLSQQRTKIELIKSENSIFIKERGNALFIRKPMFRHENAILTCDSAVLYEEANYFDAYGNVHINQADTINIYSQRLIYYGNTRKAHLTENVKMVHKDATLNTNILDYDMNTRIGTYINNGKIENKDIKVNSKNGYYFASTRDAYFRYKVVAVTEQSTITSDTLRYNTLSNLAYFYGPTNIKGKDDNLYTENGNYNTKTEDAWFGKNNLYTQGSRSMKGDSLYYYGKRGYGKAVRNITFIDTNDKTMLRGHLGEYFKAEERAVVTQNAYFGMVTGDSITVDNVKIPDTLWLGADTLETKMALVHTLKLLKPPVKTVVMAKPTPDTADKSPATTERAAVKAVTPTKKALDTLGVKDVKTLRVDTAINIDKVVKLRDAPPDTAKTRTIKAYRNVKVFKGNLQAKADSLFYTNADSTLRWFRNPMIWAEGSQQTGDTIYVNLKNKKLNTIQVLRNAFIVNVEKDSTKFNQIKGKWINGFFVDGNLNVMYVDGNAESIYYNKEKDKYKDMHQSVAGRITFLFKNKEITNIQQKLNVEGRNTPVSELKENTLLTGFIWKPELRPVSKIAVIGPPYKKPKKAPVAKSVPARATKP